MCSVLLCSARGIKLSCEVPFVKFQWLVLELPAANQRVLNSVFFVSCYILVLSYKQGGSLWGEGQRGPGPSNSWNNENDCIFYKRTIKVRTSC